VRRLVAALLVVAACGPPPAPPPPETVSTKYRVIGGLSMGAIGTAAIGLRHSEEFDAFAALGARGEPRDAQ
jgi:predicted acylesterase/phospholipase RssA